MYTVEFNNVWKKFQKGEKVYALRDAIPKLGKKLFSSGNGDLKEEEFWAVKDVSFKVKKGEVLGIIGPNGAGKSTILKLLSRISRPTQGEFLVQGRLSALIEVTAGFHPDFTGKENIYFNGSILGMTKKEIDDRYEEIVDFSGVREFIDTPVKRYSSGMSARLGFAIAAHVNPDVLLVDEVLSVGDMTFQSKCIQKMRELLKSGVTIIFISHNITLVQNFCERVILLNRGEILKQGDPQDVIPYYENLVNMLREQEIKKEVNRSSYTLEMKDEMMANIKDVNLFDDNGNIKETFNSTDPMTIEIKYKTNKVIEQPVFVFEILNANGIVCCASSTKDNNFVVDQIEGEGTINIKLPSTQLSSGVYYLRTSIWDRDIAHPYIMVKKGVFKIEKDVVNSFNGIYQIESQWSR